MTDLIAIHKKLIEDYYGDRVTERSGVPLMNHINEGIAIMKGRKARDEAIAAYCIHPIIQADADFTNAMISRTFDQFPNIEVVMLVMEYRKTANAFLCTPHTDLYTKDDIRRIAPLCSEDVREMLIADKIQNQKDFLIYHYGKHERSDKLYRYFRLWLEYLLE